jgi:1-acyl-sn-glycerol-3-phosphate acyltransferase
MTAADLTTPAERAVATARRGRTIPARFLFYLLRGTGRFLFKLTFRFEVIGRDRIPASGGFVVSPVHRSNLDFMLPAVAIRQPVRWMAKDSIFKGGMIDVFLYAMGSFPVNRSGVDRSSLLTCEQVVADGEPIVMFPEGRRKEGHTIEQLFDGPAYVACHQRVPILPIGIGGSDRAMPIGSKLVYPRKIVLVIGEPIYPDVPTEGRVPRALVTATTERLHSALQPLYDQARSVAIPAN